MNRFSLIILKGREQIFSSRLALQRLRQPGLQEGLQGGCQGPKHWDHHLQVPRSREDPAQSRPPPEAARVRRAL